MDSPEVEESQAISLQFYHEILCETTVTLKVTPNHSYIPAGLFILICFVARVI